MLWVFTKVNPEPRSFTARWKAPLTKSGSDHEPDFRSDHRSDHGFGSRKNWNK